MKHAHYLLLLIVILVIGLITYLPNKTQNSVRILAERVYKQVKEENPEGTAAELVLKGSDFYFFGTKDVKLCHVRAKESKIFPNKRKSECTGIECKLTTNKQEIATLQSPQASLDHKQQVITLTGGVTSEFVKAN